MIFHPKIHQNPSKIRSQEAFKNWLTFASIFDRFGLRFGSQVGAMLATKTPPRRPKTRPRRPPEGLRIPPRHQEGFLGRFWRQLGCVLPPKMHQKQPQEPSKIRCHLNANLPPFLIQKSTNIFSKIDAILMPTCPHFSSFWPEPKMTTNPESLQKWDPISTTKKKNK